MKQEVVAALRRFRQVGEVTDARIIFPKTYTTYKVSPRTGP